MAGAATKALHALREAAGLGLPMQQCFPDLVAALAGVVGFESWSMMALGRDHRPADVYTSTDIGPQVLARYATRWFNQEEARFYPTQQEMQTDPRLQVVRVSDFSPTFKDTEIYDEIFKEHRHGWVAGIALYGPNRPIGNLGIGRPPGARDFSDGEMALLAQARPLLAQALARSGAQCAEIGPTGIDETALLVCDEAGRILHQSANAWRLLRWAADAPANLGLLNDDDQSWAAPALAELVRRVEETLAGRESRPPALRRRTAYGDFVLRAYAMSGQGGGKAVYGVQVEHHAPLALKMAQTPAFRAMGGREQSVCRLLVQGLTQGEIAARLGLRTSTVVTHIRNVYQRLGVSRREDVAGAVLSFH